VTRSVDDQESWELKVDIDPVADLSYMSLDVVSGEVSCSDLLSNSSCFSSLDIGFSEFVKNECFASIDMTKDADNWTSKRGVFLLLLLFLLPQQLLLLLLQSLLSALHSLLLLEQTGTLLLLNLLYFNLLSFFVLMNLLHLFLFHDLNLLLFLMTRSLLHN
jgi:hypothetical protein